MLAVVERGDNAPFDEILSLFPHHPCRTFVNAVVRLPAHVLTTGRRSSCDCLAAKPEWQWRVAGGVVRWAIERVAISFAERGDLSPSLRIIALGLVDDLVRALSDIAKPSLLAPSRRTRIHRTRSPRRLCAQ